MNIVYPMCGIELSAYNKAVRVSTKTVTIRHRTLARTFPTDNRDIVSVRNVVVPSLSLPSETKVIVY